MHSLTLTKLECEVGRILTAILVDGGSPVVHAVVKKARDPLAGVFEV